MEELVKYMDGLSHSPTIWMRMSLGQELTRDNMESALLSLDNYLLDADVVDMIKEYHEDILGNGMLLTNENYL